ncbi:IdeS/Mac family cysteine endopeptidase [Treponema maltophilum]|uniref:IdeS/Mac family cysteine endopeptidase n=1 Tax=Treponema maltophilum TaxID=51160 RepID=UPI003D89C864
MIMLSLFLLLVSCKEGYTAKKAPAVPSAISVASDETSVSVVKGDTYRLQAKVLPENAANKRLSFSSSAEETASVNPDGLITAHKEGNAVITIKAANGVQKAINLTVTPEPVAVTGIEFEAAPPASLIIGDTYKLKAKVEPDNATDKSLTYAADNNNAAVAPDGMVTAQSEGSVIITVASKSAPSKTKTATIEIKKKPQIKYESIQAVMSESAAGTYTFEVQTIDGKLDYEPCFTSSTLPWVSGAPTITSRTDPNKDVISFTCLKNKTVWDRRASIRFKDKKTDQYIKGSDGKDLEVKILQKRNEYPIVHYKWVHGIGSPAENEKEKVGININGIPTGDTYPQSYVFKWKETADTKFYNVRKLDKLYVQGQFPSNYFVINGIYGEERQGKDLSQCWAKTASNMLHWWFEQNKDYIEQYKQKAAIEEWKRPLYKHDYIRGLQDEDEGKKSDIANIFRAYSHNNSRGGYIEDGLTWYLYKRDGQKNLGSIYPGLFNDVFTHDTSPITIERCETKKEFEQLMNKALDNKRAIGIFWQGSKGNRPYQHAVTCWGAAYDEDNNIICLYIAESNLPEAVLYPFGVRYKGNIYEEAEKNRTYMFNYALSKPENIYIDGLTTLDLGEEQWKAWLAAH